MESKQTGHYYYVAIGGHGNGTGTGRDQERAARPLPKRGSIKKQIFASIASKFRRMGATFAKNARAVSCCSAGKAAPIPSAQDLLRALGHELQPKSQGFCILTVFSSKEELLAQMQRARDSEGSPTVELEFIGLLSCQDWAVHFELTG